MHGQSFEWVTMPNTFNTSTGLFVEKDLSGNIYVAGVYDNSASDSTKGIFVSKFNSSGTIQWIQKMPAHLTHANGFTVDKTGNASIIGGFGNNGFIQTPTIILTSNSNNMYLIKFNTLGVLQFAIKSDLGSSAIGENVSSDDKGNIYIIGKFINKVVLPCTSFTSPSVNHCFLVKYSPTGTCLWAKHLKSWSFDGGAANSKIKTDKDGNSYISGHFFNNFQFDSTKINSHHDLSEYDQDIFLAKVDSSGNLLWVRVLGGNSQELSGPLSIDIAGNTYLSGYFSSDPAYFDSRSLNRLYPMPKDNYFTAKYNRDGNCIWVKNDYVGTICANPSGEYYTDFPGFITKYDAYGNEVWTQQISEAYNFGMATDNTNNIYITGCLKGTAIFGDDTLNSDNLQMFIAKLYDPHSTSGIIENNGDNALLNVYPNPSKGLFAISYKVSGVQQIRLSVLNTAGQCVYSKFHPSFGGDLNDSIDLSKHAKGIYLIQIVGEKSTYTRKIVLY